MHGNLPISGAVAIDVAPASDSESSFALASESDWFYDAVTAICGTKDPGFQLHLFADWPLSSCRAMCAKDPESRRKPNAEFLRRLFHSAQGRPFLRAFMHGCEAEWWRDLEQSEQRAISAETRLQKCREAIDKIE